MDDATRILDILAGEKEPFCDDCLTEEAGVSSRNYVNKLCRELHIAGKIVRAKVDACSRCGSASKITNMIDKSIRRPAAAQGSSGVIIDTPKWLKATRRGRPPSILRDIASTPISEDRSSSAMETQTLGSMIFRFIDTIDPERSASGSVWLDPAEPPSARPTVKLHSEGEGPFVRFQVRTQGATKGVYAITLDDHVVYVGICEDLGRRFNQGYGRIGWRNRFAGGRSTNCRVNKRIRDAIAGGGILKLWFFDSSVPGPIEVDLISEIQPEWNVRGVGGPRKGR